MVRPLLFGFNEPGDAMVPLTTRRQAIMNIEATQGIDVGKNVFHAVGLTATGRVVLRRQLTRSALMRFMGKLANCKGGMERLAYVQVRRCRGNFVRSARCGERHS